MKTICEKCGATENLVNGKTTPITGIIRTKNVCNKCFKEVKKDNQELMDRGKSIPDSLVTLKDLEEMEKTRIKLGRKI